MKTKTKRDLAQAIIGRLDSKYELVYVDYRDELSREQVAMVVRGDMEALWDSTSAWESDSRWQSVKTIIEDEQRAVIEDWREQAEHDDDEHALDELAELDDNFPMSDEWEDVRAEIEERDSSDWLNELARHTPDVLLRIGALDEDHAFAFQEVQPAQVLDALGIEATEHNVKIVGDCLVECSPEFSVIMGYWLVGADVSELIKLPSEGKVKITNPYLYLGNPFAGSGYITDEPLHAEITVDRSDLRTDRDAFGYSVDEVFGGLSPSSFSAGLAAVEDVPAS